MASGNDPDIEAGDLALYRDRVNWLAERETQRERLLPLRYSFHKPKAATAAVAMAAIPTPAATCCTFSIV